MTLSTSKVVVVLAFEGILATPGTLYQTLKSANAAGGLKNLPATLVTLIVPRTRAPCALVKN